MADNQDFMQFYEIGRLLDFEDTRAKIFAGIVVGYSDSEIQEITGFPSELSYLCNKELIYGGFDTKDDEEIRKIAQSIIESDLENMSEIIKKLPPTIAWIQSAPLSQEFKDYLENEGRD